MKWKWSIKIIICSTSLLKRETYRSEQRKHQVSAIAVAKNKLSDNTAFWKNVENWECLYLAAKYEHICSNVGEKLAKIWRFQMCSPSTRGGHRLEGPHLCTWRHIEGHHCSTVSRRKQEQTISLSTSKRNKTRLINTMCYHIAVTVI